MSLPDKDVFFKRTGVKLQSMIRYKKEIANARVFNNPMTTFFLQFSDGMIDIYVLSLTSRRPTASVIGQFSGPFLFEDELSFCAWCNKLLLFDCTGSMKDLQTINQSNPFLSIAPVGDYAFFVVDWRLLCMSLHTGDQFPLTRFCAESGRILTVQKGLPLRVVVHGRS